MLQILKISFLLFKTRLQLRLRMECVGTENNEDGGDETNEGYTENLEVLFK